MKNSLLTLTAIFAVLSTPAVQATVIVSDSFTAANGTGNEFRSPDVNLPGTTYTQASYYGQAKPSISGNTLLTSANNTSALSLGTYTLPTEIKVSADLELGNSNGAANLSEFFLGFSANPLNGTPHEGANNGLFAVGLTTGGDLILKTLSGGSPSSADETTTPIATYNPVALGAFSYNAFYNLSYVIDTTTGDISDITLKSSTGSVTYDIATTGFTGANLNYFALTSGSGVGGALGHADNLLLESLPVAAPEPGTWPLLLGGILLLVMVRRHRLSKA